MMNTAARVLLKNTCLKRSNGQAYIRLDCQPQSPLLAEITPIDTQQMLLMLPFEIMLKHLEATVVCEFEFACEISSKNAKELDDAFMAHVDRFEETVRAEFEKF